MEKTEVEGLVQASLAAYEAEREKKWDEALRLHQDAINLWNRFEQSGSFFSTEEREYKRIATKRVNFHKERVGILRPVVQGERSADSVLQLPSFVSLKQEALEKDSGIETANKIYLTAVSQSFFILTHTK